jgi:hypothetical protein
LVNSDTLRKLCARYLTEEDKVETEEYFQQAVVTAIVARETKPHSQTINCNAQIKSNFNEQKCDRFVQEAIDEALSSLGEIVKNAIF